MMNITYINIYPIFFTFLQFGFTMGFTHDLLINGMFEKA